MQIDFHAKGFFYGDVAKEYVEHRLGFALGRFADLVRRIEVKAEEFEKGRPSGRKQCTLQVYLNRIAEPISATVQDSSLKAAIDMAAETVNRAIARRIERRREQYRRSGKNQPTIV